MEKANQEKILRNWFSFTKAISSIKEVDLKELLKTECKGYQRQSYLNAMHQRFSRLRADRERKELLKGNFIIK